MNTITQRAATALRRLRAGESSTDPGRDEDRVDRLTQRVEHLEAALEGLQDAVYRQDVVHDKQIADLREQHRTWPEASAPVHREKRP